MKRVKCSFDPIDNKDKRYKAYRKDMLEYYWNVCDSLADGNVKTFVEDERPREVVFGLNIGRHLASQGKPTTVILFHHLL